MDLKEIVNDEELSPICEEDTYYLLQDKEREEFEEQDEDELLPTSKENNVAERECKVNTYINSETLEVGPFQPRCLQPQETDARWHTKDRKQPREIAEGYKLFGVRAFREGNYGRALQQFNLAIDLVKDSAVLYTNRALTLIILGIYSRAVSDCEWALKINEDNLRAWLYKARAHHLLGEEEQEKWCFEEAATRYPQIETCICAFISKWDFTRNQNVQ